MRYPGKLYVLGEYSVMIPGHSALIVPVNRVITIDIKASDSIYIQSTYGVLDYEKGIFELTHVKVALETAQEYLEYINVKFVPFFMNIESELDENEKKYGFGSSGTVIVAVIDSVLKYHQIQLEPLILFKLSVYAQYKMNEVSSGGDLAQAIYQKLILYTRYDLSESLTHVNCVFYPWKDLSIKIIEQDFNVSVGWTQTPYKTQTSLKEIDFSDLEIFEEANKIVLDYMNDYDIEKAVHLYRNWMKKLETHYSLDIEIQVLTDLIETAYQLGYKAKVSGAGGGDCGIVVSKETIDELALKKDWQSKGIELLEKVVVR